MHTPIDLTKSKPCIGAYSGCRWMIHHANHIRPKGDGDQGRRASGVVGLDGRRS